MNEVWMWAATDNIREDYENDHTGLCEICGCGLDDEPRAEVVMKGEHLIVHDQCYLDWKEKLGLELA